MKFINFLKSKLIFHILLFLNVCKQTFHRSHLDISQKVKSILNIKSTTYYFHMKTKVLVDFQICISVPSKLLLVFAKGLYH